MDSQSLADAARSPADFLRDQMYADPQFIADVKQGYEEGLAEQGMSLEEYAKARFLQDLQVKVDRAREALASGNTISVYELEDELDDEIGPTT